MNPTSNPAARLNWLACLAILVPLLPGCETLGGANTVGATVTDDEDTWAIRCLSLEGPNRFKLARSYADALKKVTGLKPGLVHVFHEADRSDVYYGRYRRQYDPRTDTESFRPDHLRDLDLIRQLSMNIPDATAGTRTVWPFRLATMGTLPTGRGANPQWLLTNAPGYYSLQVGVFYNTGEMRRRKYAAEEYCRLLREQGEEAYYHHGLVNSSVCIGSFPEEAIQTFQTQDRLTGIIEVTAKIVDERLLALQKKYPYNLHNLHKFYDVVVDPATGRKIRDPHGSFAVEIPRGQPDGSPFGQPQP
jgi:hypothetical protein